MDGRMDGWKVFTVYLLSLRTAAYGSHSTTLAVGTVGGEEGALCALLSFTSQTGTRTVTSVALHPLVLEYRP